MKNRIIFSVLLWATFSVNADAQSGDKDSTYRRHFIGSTLFVLATPILTPSPEYFQLNYGYRITRKDVLSVEAITWLYGGPLGRPYGPDYEKEASGFPGSVRAFGVGLAYKRFLWKRLYGQVHSTAFRQNYLDENDEKIQSGFQLFNTLRFGYQLRLFKNRVFIEPSVAATWWPVNTNLPASFQVQEDKWRNFFLFEPGMHFGINF
ncbi:MAG: hypothetical protein RIG68_07450 [Imperialibacter sp.]|uniref:hypothetical protein n=1 Tax=Imperialibacter sp. TaxID=2038411 RepID=UPI0032EABAD9